MVHSERTAQKGNVTPHHGFSRKVSTTRKTHRTVYIGNKEEGSIKTAAVWSEGSKIKNTIIDINKWQPTRFMVPSFEKKLGDLNKLEKQLLAQWTTEVTQNRRKAWHDKHLKLNKFQPGQWVLRYDGRNEIKPGKFKVKWVGYTRSGR